jgi:hypothetical protein
MKFYQYEKKGATFLSSSDSNIIKLQTLSADVYEYKQKEQF